VTVASTSVATACAESGSTRTVSMGTASVVSGSVGTVFVC
jgi:hypothetical protein